jgi:hypothetical protein
MCAMELQPLEGARAEGAEAAQTQDLNEATFEPEARIEQAGDYKQSEAIQAGFTAVVDTTASAAVHAYAGETAHAGEAPAGVAALADNSERTAGGRPAADGAALEARTEYTPLDLSGALGIPRGASETGGLPGVKTPSADAGAPVKGVIAEEPSEAGQIKFDPDTGQVSGFIPSGDGEETRNSSVALRKPESNGEPGLAEGTMSRKTELDPAALDRAGAYSPRPIGRDVSDEPTAMKQTSGGNKEGFQNPSGPQELANQRFADQALNALGVGTQGAITGGRGVVVGQAGLAAGADQDYAGVDLSTKHGAAVHHYGSGKIGVEQEEDSEEPPANDGPAPLTDPHGIQATDSEGNEGKGTNSVGSVTTIMEGDRLFWIQTLDQDKHSKNMGDVETYKHEYVLFKHDTGNYTAVRVYNSIDAGNPMPYTGNWTGGKFNPKDPGTSGGKSAGDDSGRVMPVIRHSGMGRQGAGGNNATDDTSVHDDGHYYGGIFGGGGIILSDNQPGAVDPIQGGEIFHKGDRK